MSEVKKRSSGLARFVEVKPFVQFLEARQGAGNRHAGARVGHPQGGAVSRNRQLFLVAVVLLAFVLQLSVMPQFKLLGVQPDLILVVAVVVAVQDGPIEGAVIGFAGGMLQDIASPQVMGVSALTKTLAAFIAGVLKDFFMTYSILLPVVLVFFLSLLRAVAAPGCPGGAGPGAAAAVQGGADVRRGSLQRARGVGGIPAHEEVPFPGKGRVPVIDEARA